MCLKTRRLIVLFSMLQKFSKKLYRAPSNHTIFKQFIILFKSDQWNTAFSVLVIVAWPSHFTPPLSHTTIVSVLQDELQHCRYMWDVKTVCKFWFCRCKLIVHQFLVIISLFLIQNKRTFPLNIDTADLLRSTMISNVHSTDQIDFKWNVTSYHRQPILRNTKIIF